MHLALVCGAALAVLYERVEEADEDGANGTKPNRRCDGISEKEKQRMDVECFH